MVSVPYSSPPFSGFGMVSFFAVSRAASTFFAGFMGAYGLLGITKQRGAGKEVGASKRARPAAGFGRYTARRMAPLSTR